MIGFVSRGGPKLLPVSNETNCAVAEKPTVVGSYELLYRHLNKLTGAPLL